MTYNTDKVTVNVILQCAKHSGTITYNTDKVTVNVMNVISLSVFCSAVEALLGCPAPCVPPSASWSLTAKEPVQQSDQLCSD